jgi:hypothetical protein
VKAAEPVRLDSAIEKPARTQQTLSAELAPAKPQLNAQGDTIGKLINVVA